VQLKIYQKAFLLLPLLVNNKYPFLLISVGYKDSIGSVLLEVLKVQYRAHNMDLTRAFVGRKEGSTRRGRKMR
jgi:hypothetical protein